MMTYVMIGIGGGLLIVTLLAVVIRLKNQRDELKRKRAQEAAAKKPKPKPASDKDKQPNKEVSKRDSPPSSDRSSDDYDPETGNLLIVRSKLQNRLLHEENAGSKKPRKTSEGELTYIRQKLGTTLWDDY
jgi:hypothetical protein